MNELGLEDVCCRCSYRPACFVSEEDEGRIYPRSNKAATVVDVLRHFASPRRAPKACCFVEGGAYRAWARRAKFRMPHHCAKTMAAALVCADGAVEAFGFGDWWL